MRKTASGYRLIFGYLGLFIAFVGIATLLPLFTYIAYPKEVGDWYCFVIPGSGAILLGSFMFGLLIAGRHKAQLSKHQDFVLLVLVWLTAIFISAVPFLIKGNLDFTNAIFETTSAYATIGLTTFDESDLALHAFVIYRSLLCFLGGIGLVLIVTSALSDRYGLKLYVAEGHNDKLMPNLAKSARLILSIYVGITVLGIILYKIAGMDTWLDAIVHSISGVATGGFSSRKEGIMAFRDYPNFWAIQVISIFLMLAGATNFLLTFFLLTGRFKKFFKDCEIRLLAILFLIFIPIFTLSAYFGGNNLSFGKSFLSGSFTFVSAITTTGFSNISKLTDLGQTTIFLITIVNVIGGGIGSTAGGVKQYRLAVALKSFHWSSKEATASSNTIFPHYIWRFGEEKEIDQKEISAAFSYILLYVLIMITGGFLITIFEKGLDYGTGLFEFSNAISSTGLSFDIYKNRPVGVRWTLILGMFAGRLEIFPLYYAFYRIMRDIFRKETY